MRRLDEIRARERKATPGPWRYRREDTDRIIEVEHSCETGNCFNLDETAPCIGGHVILREDSRPSWANRLHDEAEMEEK